MLSPFLGSGGCIWLTAADGVDCTEGSEDV